MLTDMCGGVDDYFSLKSQVAAHLAARLNPGCEVVINTLDDPDAKDESEIHLTVTGLSAEHGDDGEVGRGNRINGLITPYRPMSLEAAAGKNPVAHVGKIYNVLAHRMAGRIVADVAGVDEVVVRLLSGIGRPIDQPQLVAVSVVAEAGLSQSQEQEIHELISQQLANLPTMVKELSIGHLSVFWTSESHGLRTRDIDSNQLASTSPRRY
uniref:methionine adenosyltransferase n=1 Tax=Cupriavidus yeoncheonensis TaxID=1462994 RepID=UPI003F494620